MALDALRKVGIIEGLTIMYVMRGSYPKSDLNLRQKFGGSWFILYQLFKERIDDDGMTEHVRYHSSGNKALALDFSSSISIARSDTAVDEPRIFMPTVKVSSRRSSYRLSSNNYAL